MTFYCEECGAVFKDTEMEDQDNPTCPECGSEDVRHTTEGVGET